MDIDKNIDGAIGAKIWILKKRFYWLRQIMESNGFLIIYHDYTDRKTNHYSNIAIETSTL